MKYIVSSATLKQPKRNMLPILSAVKGRPKSREELYPGLPHNYCSVSLPKHDRIPPARAGVTRVHKKQGNLKVYGITRREQLNVSS